MKPKYLEIEGLHSFTGMQRIDFESLGETGLFGIFGPTGSGKSTILDAITFALYGKVKRAEGGTQGIINTGCATARVSFTFTLSKNGVRKTYRVERTYRRKKDSPNSCEPRVARLVEITESGDVPICDKATEVTGYVKELLGLSGEDFTRAVVLPQNSFQEFLLLNNKDRKAMLERIFYLEEYGQKLEEKLRRKMASMKSRLDLLAGELKGYEDSTEESLHEAERAMKDALAERKRVEKEFEELEKKYNEAKEIWGLSQELDELRRKEEMHLAAWEAANKKRMLLEKALKAEELQEMIHAEAELSGKLEDTARKLREVSEELSRVGESLNRMKINCEELENRAKTERPELERKRASLVEALALKNEIRPISEKLETMRDSIRRLKNAEERKNELIVKGTAEYEALVKEAARLKTEMEPLKVDPDYRLQIQEGVGLENEIGALETSAGELEERLKGAEEARAGIEARLRQVKEEIGRLGENIEVLESEKLKHQEACPGDKNTLLRAIEKIHEVKSRYDMLAFRAKELERARLDAAKFKDIADRLDLDLRGKEEEKRKALAALEQSRELYRKATDEMKAFSAYMLSKELREGEPCPVCGSRDHPAPAASVSGAEAREPERNAEEAKYRMEEAEKAYGEAERKALVAVEKLKTALDRALQANEELERKAAEFEEEKRVLPEKLRGMELAQINGEIEKASKLYSEKMDAMEKWEKKLSDLDQKINLLNASMVEKKLAENEATTELKINGENEARLRADLDAAKKSLDTAREKLRLFLERHGIASAGAEMGRLLENDRKEAILREKAEKANEEAGRKRMEVDRLKEEWRSIYEERVRKEAEEAGLQKQMADGMERLRRLAGDADIEEETRFVDRIIEELSAGEENARRELKALEKRHNELATEKSTLENQEKIFADSLEKERSRLGRALGEKGFSGVAEAMGSIMSGDRKKELKNEIDEYDRVSANIRAQKLLLEKKLGSRNISEDEWNNTGRAYAELAVYRQDCVSRGEVARNNYSNISKKHSRWKELSKEYNELNHKYGLFEQIQKLLKAEHRKDNSFIDYVAEERLRYVAAKASQTLGAMTNYRYALELDAEAGFIVRDQANGGAYRLIRSLSGGEIFLASLSLALALSEHIQLKGQSPLEFFFLDEGFGMLDHDLLDTVMDSLERLSGGNRVIGLISHVPELKSRIGRRLIVIPPTFRGEGSRVMIEKA